MSMPKSQSSLKQKYQHSSRKIQQLHEQFLAIRKIVSTPPKQSINRSLHMSTNIRKVDLYENDDDENIQCKRSPQLPLLTKQIQNYIKAMILKTVTCSFVEFNKHVEVKIRGFQKKIDRLRTIILTVLKTSRLQNKDHSLLLHLENLYQKKLHSLISSFQYPHECRQKLLSTSTAQTKKQRSNFSTQKYTSQNKDKGNQKNNGKNNDNDSENEKQREKEKYNENYNENKKEKENDKNKKEKENENEKQKEEEKGKNQRNTKENNQVSNDMKDIQNKMKEYEEQKLRRIKEIMDKDKLIQNKDKEIGDMGEKVRKLVEEVEGKDGQIRVLKERINRIKEEFEEKDKLIKRLEKIVQEKDLRILEIQKKIEQLENYKCPKCLDLCEQIKLLQQKLSNINEKQIQQPIGLIQKVLHPIHSKSQWNESQAQEPNIMENETSSQPQSQKSSPKSDDSSLQRQDFNNLRHTLYLTGDKADPQKKLLKKISHLESELLLLSEENRILTAKKDKFEEQVKENQGDQEKFILQVRVLREELKGVNEKLKCLDLCAVIYLKEKRLTKQDVDSLGDQSKFKREYLKKYPNPKPKKH